MKIEILSNSDLKGSKSLLIPVGFKDVPLACNTVNGLEKALSAHNFKAEKGRIITFNSLADFKKVVLLGLGDNTEIFKNNYNSMDLGGKLASALTKFDEEASIVLSHIEDKDLVKNLALCLTSGIRLKSYKFTKYFTKKEAKLNDLEKLSTIKVITNKVEVSSEVEYSKALVEGIFLTRDLVIAPANEIYPETFVEKLKELLPLGVELEVLHQKDLEELKMGSLLSVNKASSKEAKVAIIKWNGGGNSKPLAFVGKGVTFDTGGLSLKPAGAMIGMKGDMAGAATVAGLIKTLAIRKAKVNVIGVVGLVENVVSSDATKPGDVVTSYSGKTIEVLNTDAEGRLVLADVLSYTEEKFKPEFIIDLATLTGAIIVALGYLRAGLFSNNRDLENKLLESGNISGDKLWSLPVTDEYRSMMDSQIADIANLSNIDRAAGSVTAAIFLKDFIGNAKWAHIDIAGVAWRPTDTDLGGKGSSGFGVRLLDTLIANYYESK